jgi:CheY-like chemotaxis protein
MEAVGRLAGGLAHDFNNLLTAIMGYCDFLAEDLGSEHPRHPDVLEIRKAGERAAGLTRQLLAFSRKQVMQPKVLDLGAVVAGVEKMVRRLVPESIAVVIGTPRELGRVKADPGQVEQVIMNLCVNARDAMVDAGTLTLEASNVEIDEASARAHGSAQPGRYVALAVSDTGTGMSAETRAHLFEPFFTTKEPGKGTGLGLATVYGIVKQSGGHVWVYSELGLGSTFKVLLPRIDAPAAVDAAAAPAVEGRPGSETILLVEDDASVRTIAKQTLERLGYRVLVAREGGEGVALAARHEGRIDLLLTDVVMPGLSGRAVADRLAPARPEMRVLFMSGYTEDAIVHHGVLDEGIAFIEKPFTPKHLGRVVRARLDGEPLESTRAR